MLFEVITTVLGIAYLAFVSFHVYYEAFKGETETVQKYTLSETHKTFMRWFGLIWAIVFFASWGIPAIVEMERTMFFILSVASLPWVFNAGVILYKERKSK